jgi:hypothetical protein
MKGMKMGMLTDWLDKVFERSWNRVRERRHQIAISTADVPRQYTGVSRNFVVREALNGTFIEFARHKWNQSKADDYEQCIYIVRENETLVDAIATVLVLMDKPEV